MKPIKVILLISLLLLGIAACNPANEGAAGLVIPPAPGTTGPAGSSPTPDTSSALAASGATPLSAPTAADTSRINVVATTSIIGDVVAQVGGEHINLTILMAPGQDPHSYEPAARDLTAVFGADVIFVNGWDLEEGLVDDLETISQDGLIVSISASIEPLALDEADHEDDDHDDDDNGDDDDDDGDDDDGDDDDDDDNGDDDDDDDNGDDDDDDDNGDDDDGNGNNDDQGSEIDDHAHEHSGNDPHVWFSIPNVVLWVEQAARVLSDLDPANAADYAANAAAYRGKLDGLAAETAMLLAQIPAGNRMLVTNHDSLNYFAHEYGFEILGTVLPGGSTTAEPAAGELADLITLMAEHNVCTIFTETTVSDALAQTVAAELDNCDTVQVLPLYTGSLGPAGSDADTYLTMFRFNVETIVTGLR